MLAQLEFAKFVEHEPSLAHHTASAADPVEPMHEEHVARRRAVAFVKRTAPVLLEMDVMRVVQVAHAVATAALTDAAMDETADVVSFPPTTAEDGKPESVTARLVVGVLHAAEDVEPAGAVVPVGQAVQAAALPPSEKVSAGHEVHAPELK